MKLILTAMVLAIAAPVAAHAGPTSPPHAPVPHGGADPAPVTAPAADPHAGHRQAPPDRGAHPSDDAAHHQGMACCQHAAAEGANAQAADACCCCCRHHGAEGAEHGAEGAPAAPGTDHGAHAGHGG